MFLSEIWIYPVKSLGGIRLKASHAEEKGLRHDRRWMIVDQNGIFLTQRDNLKMALLDVSFHEDGLIISYRFEPENHILVPFVSASGESMQVKVWNDVVVAFTICDRADAWLSEQLGKKVRIVQMGEDTRRKMDPLYASDGALVSFADDFPYLLISEASLHDLNSKLAEPVDMRRFRPNFVVSGTIPFAEDTWNHIKIGNIAFRVSKPCERCVLINIDPEKGIKGSEPLKTLATYRKDKRKINFGQNLVGLQSGTIHEGDVITVII